MDRWITDKIGRVLYIYAASLLLIFMRTADLSLVQASSKKIEAEAPRKRSIKEPVERATIRDRLNIPLAINKVTYDVTFSYAPLTSIPRSQSKGKERVFPRKEYITHLTQTLSKDLEMDPESLEDKICAEAALSPQTPILLKENISEATYAKLKTLEKDLPGICATRRSTRFYPQGKTACGIVGYMGVMDGNEYKRISQETYELENYFHMREEGLSPPLPKNFQSPAEVRARLYHLQEKAYTAQDFIGKAGIEKMYDAELRGLCGKKNYEVDKWGHVTRQLPGSYPGSAGKRILLTISSELQSYAEQLLIEHESAHPESPPWIKGGAIVVMDPNTGDILTLASHPRFDPNDFLLPTKERSAQVTKWLESPSYIAQIWDGKRPLTRERCTAGKFYEESTILSWEHYLDSILPQENATRQSLEALENIKAIVLAQKDPQPDKSLLFLDLCHLLAPQEKFCAKLLEQVGHITPSQHRKLNQLYAVAEGAIRQQVEKLFHKLDFALWRKDNFSTFIVAMREEEKEKKRYAHPYTEYIRKKEKELFTSFWKEHKKEIIETIITDTPCTSDTLLPYIEQIDPSTCKILKEEMHVVPKEATAAYLTTFCTFEELTTPLHRYYPMLRHNKGLQTEKDLASAFYPLLGYGYCRSHAFRESTPQGSPFKLVPAYAALLEKYDLIGPNAPMAAYNPLSLIDDVQWSRGHKNASQILGYTASGEPITRLYKNGRLPQSSHPHIGSIDVIGAIEQSSNIYFSILASEHISHPQKLIQATHLFGFGNKTGIDLPGEIRGVVPEDIEYDKTGLYAFAIGQHSLVTTPLQTAVMLSALANGGKILKPKIVYALAGNTPSRQDALRPTPHFPLQTPLGLIGIDFPLFTETKPLRITPEVTYPPTEILRTIPLPKEIRYTLLEGMRRAVQTPKGTARASTMQNAPYHPHAIQDYKLLSDQIIGKTGTAEIMHSFSIDPEDKAHIHNHVWFAGISFPTPQDTLNFENPELVVIVYLRFGGWGKEAAPLAAQIVKKWRSIRDQ